MITVTMPGKQGDILLSIPVALEIGRLNACDIRIVTSDYCAPVVPLLMAVPEIARITVLPESVYRIVHTHHGAQPWEMPIDGPAYHLGFRHFPHVGQPVTHLAGEPYGVVPAPGPWLPRVPQVEPSYLAGEVEPGAPETVAVHIGERPASYRYMLRYALDGEKQRGIARARCVRLIGTRGELLSSGYKDYFTDSRIDVRVVEDYLDIWHALAGCSLFVGVNSGPSIVAMGAGLPVIWPHRPDIEQERWAHVGCEVSTLDQHGVVRKLRD